MSVRYFSVRNNRKNSLKTKKDVDWTLPRFCQCLFNRKISYLNQVVQIFTGYCNLLRHKKTSGRSKSSTCPNFSLKNETTNYNESRYKCYQNFISNYHEN